MSNFQVTVNGRVYDVTVKELTPNNNQAIQQSQSQPAAVKEEITLNQPAIPPTSAPVTVDAGDKPVVAPLTGTIISLKVKPGDQVKYGDVLLTLEALKMENEIVAPQAGTVKTIFIQNGSTVNVGDVLLTLV